MAKKIQNNESLELKDAIEGISLQTEIQKQDIINILKEVLTFEFSEFLNVMDDDLDVEVDENFTAKLFQIKEVISTVEYPATEVSLEEATKYTENPEEGDMVRVPVQFDILDRRTIKQIFSNLNYRLRNLHKELIYKELKEKEGSLVTGTIIRRSGRDIFMTVDKTEGRLPYREQSPREFFKQGDKTKVLLKQVELDENNRLSVLLSRTDPEIVRNLFSIEVPEVADGTVRIRDIVREAGQKIKMSVSSNKAGVEPVGACVGLSGIRIKAVITELSGEKIDVIPYNTNPREFIARAMQPAKVLKVLIINEEDKEALVVVDDESLPLAIGKGGTNIKLATKLTGWNINLKTQAQIAKKPEILEILSKADDIFSFDASSDLHQLTEIDEELIVRLMNSGIITIAELYEKTVNEIAKIEGISEENAKTIRKVLDEMVEVVDEEDDFATRERYMNEFEDELQGVNTDEQIDEEFQQVEFLVCPSCGFEFEYTNQSACPSCGVEFEFEEEEEEVIN